MVASRKGLGSLMPAQTPRRLLDKLRARGIRLTSQRAVLVNILDAEDRFVDVPTLCSIARRRGARVDRATVYRTLALLRNNNLLAPAAGAASDSETGAAAAPPLMDEWSLVCERCGTRQPVAANMPDSIKRELQRCTGFRASAVRLEAGGECRLCSAKARLRTRSKGEFQQ
jgi:Fe2+ or Zn2+ uptake regulation protein